MHPWISNWLDSSSTTISCCDEVAVPFTESVWRVRRVIPLLAFFLSQVHELHPVKQIWIRYASCLDSESDNYTLLRVQLQITKYSVLSKLSLYLSVCRIRLCLHSRKFNERSRYDSRKCALAEVKIANQHLTEDRVQSKMEWSMVIELGLQCFQYEKAKSTSHWEERLSWWGR